MNDSIQARGFFGGLVRPGWLLLAAGLAALPGLGAAQSESVIPIGAIQGEVADGDDGLASQSPLAGQQVRVQAVVFGKVAWLTRGERRNGIFIQNTAATADKNPNTSDGIFVFMSRGTTLMNSSYTPAVGDEIVIVGEAAEYQGCTQISRATLATRVRTGVDLDAELPPVELDPPSEAQAANVYWERIEGMRARVGAGAPVVAGRHTFPGSKDGEVYVIAPPQLADRAARPYERRVFRDPHPLDNVSDRLFDDGNAYRILLGSLGLKGAQDDENALIAPARTFDALAEPATGGVYFSFGKYSLMPDRQLALKAGPDPSKNGAPAPPDLAKEFLVASYNLENLYDYRDDPTDQNDFPGNAGENGIEPPFNYVPESDEPYRARLKALAAQIIGELHSPDLILAQEAEDQDIGGIKNGAFDAAAGPDGKPDTVQELALAIAAAGGPAYDCAFDRDGADARGIVAAFMFRTDRVKLAPADAADPVLGAAPKVEYAGAAEPMNAQAANPKAMNAALPPGIPGDEETVGATVYPRAAQAGKFVFSGPGGKTAALYAVNNHFSSRPNDRVAQRKEQAAYSAAIASAILAADPEALVIVGGDLNVYPRPDDAFAPGEEGFPSDQLRALYAAGLSNLMETVAAEAPAAAYTYVYMGQAQTLDHLFVSPALKARLVQARPAHINADWPGDEEGDGPRGASDHDPMTARFKF